MNLLYALESVRTPFWDAVFSAVTHLGEETVFMVAAILIFWCVSKQEGYYLLLMGFFGTVVNQFLKLLFRMVISAVGGVLSYAPTMRSRLLLKSAGT